MIAKEYIMNWPKGAHGNTYGGNPIACAAALATLDLIENGYLQNAAKMGEYMLRQLLELQSRHSSIGDVRGKGLMIGVEFVENQETKARYDCPKRIYAGSLVVRVWEEHDSHLSPLMC
jgi:4-aminobutyrate aminotransferase